jgi:hypothetical protein
MLEMLTYSGLKAIQNPKSGFYLQAPPQSVLQFALENVKTKLCLAVSHGEKKRKEQACRVGFAISRVIPTIFVSHLIRSAQPGWNDNIMPRNIRKQWRAEQSLPQHGRPLPDMWRVREQTE